MFSTNYTCPAGAFWLLLLFFVGLCRPVAAQVSTQEKDQQTPGSDFRDGPLPIGALSRLGTTCFRHKDRVFCAIFARSGDCLATAGQDGTIRVWDPVAGIQISRIKLPDGCSKLAVSPDGLTLATDIAPETIGIFQSKTGKIIRRFTVGEARTLSLAYSFSGKQLAVGSEDGKIYLCETGAGTVKHIMKMEGHSPVTALAFGQEEDLLAAAGTQPCIFLWNAPTGSIVRKLEWREDPANRNSKEAVTCLAFSPDGLVLASGTDHGSIHLWEAGSGKEVRSIQIHNGAVLSVAFSPDGKVSGWGGGDSSGTSDVSSGKIIHKFSDWGTDSISFSSDGRTLATTGGTFVDLWDVETGKERPRPPEHVGPVKSVSWSPSGKMVATSGPDLTIRVWDATCGKQIQRFKQRQGRFLPATGKSMADHPLWVVFSPNGAQVITTDSGNAVPMWDATSGKESRPLLWDGTVACDCAVTRDGARLVMQTPGKANKEVLRLCNALDGKVIRTFTNEIISDYGAECEPNQGRLALSRDDHYLAATNRGSLIRIWDIENGRLLRSFDAGPLCNVTAVTFSPDGRHLVAGTGRRLDIGSNGPAPPLVNTIRIWDFASGRQELVLDRSDERIEYVANGADFRHNALPSIALGPGRAAR